MKSELIVEPIEQNRLRVTEHADEEALDDGLSHDEVIESVLSGRSKITVCLPDVSCLTGACVLPLLRPEAEAS